MTPTEPSVSCKDLSILAQNCLTNAHRHNVQENATHVITVSFVMVPVFMFVTVIVIMIMIARVVLRRFHPMVVVVVMVML
jgi:hypothetical protein